MTDDELTQEMADGVIFWCYELGEQIVGVAGLQDRGEVNLIRHAYVRPSHQRRGVGSALLSHLAALTRKPILIGTWAAAHWAVSFYRKHGFRLVPATETATLLKHYWSIPDRQVVTSVVLGDARWFDAQQVGSV
jgi:GNAT superfamily N-acetyltransferase